MPSFFPFNSTDVGLNAWFCQSQQAHCRASTSRRIMRTFSYMDPSPEPSLLQGGEGHCETPFAGPRGRFTTCLWGHPDLFQKGSCCCCCCCWRAWAALRQQGSLPTPASSQARPAVPHLPSRLWALSLAARPLAMWTRFPKQHTGCSSQRVEAHKARFVFFPVQAQPLEGMCGIDA